MYVLTTFARVNTLHKLVLPHQQDGAIYIKRNKETHTLHKNIKQPNAMYCP